jgi:hypothetical protein
MMDEAFTAFTSLPLSLIASAACPLVCRTYMKSDRQRGGFLFFLFGRESWTCASVGNGRSTRLVVVVSRTSGTIVGPVRCGMGCTIAEEMCCLTILFSRFSLFLCSSLCFGRRAVEETDRVSLTLSRLVLGLFPVCFFWCFFLFFFFILLCGSDGYALRFS